MDAISLLESIRRDNPNLKFALSDTGNAIGCWSEKHGRYQTCVGKLLTGKWVQLHWEILTNDNKPQDSYIAAAMC